MFFKHDNYNMKPMVAYLLFEFSLVRCFFIQKCCGREQQLDASFRHCINFDGNEGIEKYETNITYDKDGINFVKLGQNDVHHLWWLPKDIRFVSSRTFKEVSYDRVHNLQFRYNRGQPCPESEISIVPFNDNVFLLDNGALLMTGVDDNLRPKTVIYPAYTYCLDRVSLRRVSRAKRSTHLIEHSFAILLCPCMVLQCVHLCCHRKTFLNRIDGNEICQYSHNLSPAWNLTYTDYNGKEISRGRGFGVLKSIPKCSNFYYFNENVSDWKKFSILPNGNAKPENSQSDFPYQDYCIHYTNVSGRFRPNLRICEPTIRMSNLSPSLTQLPFGPYQDILYIIYFVVGALFLALTLLVHTLLPELRKIEFNDAFVYHVTSLFVCYTTMAVDKIANFSAGMWCCRLSGHIIQMSFIASMLWLNVMCLRISTKFRSLSSIKKPEFLEKCLCYPSHGFYVWSLSAIITCFTFLADEIFVTNQKWKPNLGNRNCWFTDFQAQFLYFYLPVSAILTVNSVIFIFTTRTIWKSHKQSKMIFKHDCKKYVGKMLVNEQSLRLSLYARLFALMGITWTFEILSWALGGGDYLWYVTDAINCLRGLFVFVIYSYKKKVFVLILNRLFVAKSNNISVNERCTNSIELSAV